MTGPQFLSLWGQMCFEVQKFSDFLEVDTAYIQYISLKSQYSVGQAAFCKTSIFLE